MMEVSSSQRERMVNEQLVARGIKDPLVIAAMKSVPREAFIPTEFIDFAYEDTPLPIEQEQTISQPYIVALMIEALDLTPEDQVLEVGTGSGYAAAVLAEVAKKIYTIERHANLAQAARRKFETQGYDNVFVRHGDGTLGWEEHAPFDAIVVTAGGPEIPQQLLDQLAIGGRLVIPTGRSPRSQDLIRVTRLDDSEYRQENLGRVRFVPLIGKAGWRDKQEKDAGNPGHEPPSPASNIRDSTESIFPMDT